jgi:hypothetical protein
MPFSWPIFVHVKNAFWCTFQMWSLCLMKILPGYILFALISLALYKSWRHGTAPSLACTNVTCPCPRVMQWARCQQYMFLSYYFYCKYSDSSRTECTKQGRRANAWTWCLKTGLQACWHSKRCALFMGSPSLRQDTTVHWEDVSIMKFGHNMMLAGGSHWHRVGMEAIVSCLHGRTSVLWTFDTTWCGWVVRHYA